MNSFIRSYILSELINAPPDGAASGLGAQRMLKRKCLYFGVKADEQSINKPNELSTGSNSVIFFTSSRSIRPLTEQFEQSKSGRMDPLTDKKSSESSQDKTKRGEQICSCSPLVIHLTRWDRQERQKRVTIDRRPLGTSTELRAQSGVQNS